MTNAFEDAAANLEWDNEWNWFFSESGYNSFFFGSEFVALHGIAKIIGETDLIKAQTKLINLVMPISDDMSHLIHAIIAVLWQKYFGEELLAERRIDINDAPSFFDVWVPFFVEIPPEPPAPPSRS